MPGAPGGSALVVRRGAECARGAARRTERARFTGGAGVGGVAVPGVRSRASRYGLLVALACSCEESDACVKGRFGGVSALISASATTVTAFAGAEVAVTGASAMIHGALQPSTASVAFGGGLWAFTTAKYDAVGGSQSVW